MGRSDPVRGCTCTEGRPSHGEAGFAGQTAAPTTAPPCLSLASLRREPPALALSLGSPAWDFVGPPPGLPVGRLPRGRRSLFPPRRLWNRPGFLRGGGEVGPGGAGEPLAFRARARDAAGRSGFPVSLTRAAKSQTLRSVRPGFPATWTRGISGFGSHSKSAGRAIFTSQNKRGFVSTSL